MFHSYLTNHGSACSDDEPCYEHEHEHEEEEEEEDDNEAEDNDKSSDDWSNDSSDESQDESSNNDMNKEVNLFTQKSESQQMESRVWHVIFHRIFWQWCQNQWISHCERQHGNSGQRTSEFL